MRLAVGERARRGPQHGDHGFVAAGRVEEVVGERVDTHGTEVVFREELPGSVHETGPREWRAKIGKIPVLVGVCEGFVGNVILKVSEGMADFLFKSVTPAVLSRLDVERGQAKQAFEDVQCGGFKSNA